MKKTIIIFTSIIVFILSGCDGTEKIIATEEYCNDFPKAAICDGFNTEVNMDAMINSLFNTIISDYNDITNEFNCNDYFTDNNNLLSECQNNSDFFAPNEYTTITLIEFDNTTGLEYTLHTNTNNIPDNIDFDLELVLNEDSLKISSWSYSVIPNPDLTSFEIIAYEFKQDYNNTSLDSSTVCSTWLENMVDSSNCEVIRSTRISSNTFITFKSIQTGTYNIITYTVGQIDNESSNEKFVILSNNKLADSSRVFKVTDIYNYGIYSFMNTFMNENVENNDICGNLESGDFDCRSIRDDIFEEESVTFYPGVLLSDGYLNNDLDYSFTFTVVLEDSSTITILINCKVKGTETQFSDYDLDFSEYN